MSSPWGPFTWVEELPPLLQFLLAIPIFCFLGLALMLLPPRLFTKWFEPSEGKT